jgi:hypothetical protein
MEPRNYLANAGATPPAAPGTPSNGYPQAGVPGVSDPTTPGPFWFYKFGEEARAIIVLGGLTPDDETLNQVALAIQAIVADVGDLRFAALAGSAAQAFLVAAATASDEAVNLGQMNALIGTYVNVTGSRVAGTTYTNTTGKPMFVSATISSTVANFSTLTVNGVVADYANSINQANNATKVCGWVPPGGTYVVAVSAGTKTTTNWSEGY